MKRLFLNLKIAIRSLCNFRLRTILALLGVFLGTFSLIVVYNFSSSLEKKTESEVESFGKNLLIVRSGIVRRFGPGTRLLTEATTLTVNDAKAILEGSPLVYDVSPSTNKSYSVRYRNTNLSSVLVIGSQPNYSYIRNFYVKEGSFISHYDNNNLNKVVVIGKKVAEKLFGNENPIGKHILIHRVPCQVIGIMEEKGVDISGIDQDNVIFVPLNTFLRTFVNRDFVNTIYVQVVEEASIKDAKTDVENILRERHKVKKGNEDFSVIDMKDVTALKTQAMSMIKVLGRIASIISFVIGGIGIISIMILIVNERKVEIGIRRAVGSRKKDIVSQFLIEASFISLFGGVIGVFLGFIVSLIIFESSDLPITISIAGLILSFIASVTVGILAGIYPSKKAIAIQPIDIIRSG